MIRAQLIVDNARKYLKECILRGDFQPGQQLKEQEISTLLAISRPPVREAMKLLEGEGLIVRKPNRGAFVAMINENDAWEIYTLKSELYVLATKLAFEKFNDGIILDLEKTVNKMESCAEKDPVNILKYQELNFKFHDIIITLSGHKRLKKIVEILHNQVTRFSCMSLEREAHLMDSLNYHRQILIAFKNRDLDSAVALTREHIMCGLETVQEVIARELRTLKPTGTETE